MDKFDCKSFWKINGKLLFFSCKYDIVVRKKIQITHEFKLARGNQTMDKSEMKYITH